MPQNTEQNLANSITFDNFDLIEKQIYVNSLAFIFAKRLIKENIALFFPSLKNQIIRINEGIPDNFTLPNSGPKYGCNPITWTPKAKFKIQFGEQFPYSDFEQRVWFEIIFNKPFETADKDVIYSVLQDMCQHQYGEFINVILSCLVIPDNQNSTIEFNFYLLGNLKQWKKLKTYYYNGFKKSNIFEGNSSDLATSKLISFKNLTPQERGSLGEALGKILGRRLLIENKALFFPEFENELINAELGSSWYFTYLGETVNLDVKRRQCTWEPDLVFRILTNVDPNDLIFELAPKKMVFFEVKTGKNATFERSQKEDMEYWSMAQNYLVLYCNILPDSDDSKLNITFKRVRYNTEWEPVSKFSYSDFFG